jgi:hypothetical protein
MNFMSGDRVFKEHANLALHRKTMENDVPRFSEYWANSAKKSPFKMPGAKINN